MAPAAVCPLIDAGLHPGDGKRCHQIRPGRMLVITPVHPDRFYNYF